MCFIHRKKNPFLSLDLSYTLENTYSFKTFFSPYYPNISGFHLNRDMYRQNLLGNEPSSESFLGITVQFLFIVTSSGNQLYYQVTLFVMSVLRVALGHREIKV